ncbi:MAG: ABC transporter permease subunit [Fusobacterium sp.]|uniref:PhnE/PtxC family ABC transporter permease n=1 Tax=Fusobacterium sp. TaxID=68766 RepID=UPI0026DC397B|nr:ABC transporter permease subunit [Fusobacterium sp.]MDO4690256.1 ABC transporter permease subunit [Fusobacterium sp.]
MTLEKFIKIQKIKNLIKCSLYSIFLLLFFLQINLSFEDFLQGFIKLTYILKGMSRIDFSDYGKVLFKVFETFIIAFVSSFFGVLFAALFSPFFSSYTIKNKYILKILNSIFSIFRTVPALVFAAILVNLIGTGSFTGFISLFIITFFSASKLIKEYLEEIAKERINSFKSLAFSKFTFFRACVYPISKPYILSIFFLSLESSMRGASVLGMVGAGGIGQELWKNLNYLRYDKVSFIIVLLLLFIFITDSISYFFRKKDDFLKTSSYRAYSIQKNIKIFFALFLFFILFYFLKILYLSADMPSLSTIFERFFEFLKKMGHIDFSYYKKAILALLESFSLAFFATFLAAPTAIILSFFANSNISNSKVSILAKFFINLIRTFPPVIVAIIFFSGFGPSFISGFFALYLYTTGVISKVYTDILESSEIDYGLYGKSIGLKKFYTYLRFWIPSTYTNFISILLYRFESNMKNSSILGMVGAGGIGELLINHINYRNWEKVWFLLLILIFTIILIENISIYVRTVLKK